MTKSKPKVIILKGDLVHHIEAFETEHFTKVFCGVYVRNDRKLIVPEKENPVYICIRCKVHWREHNTIY